MTRDFVGGPWCGRQLAISPEIGAIVVCGAMSAERLELVLLRYPTQGPEPRERGRYEMGEDGRFHYNETYRAGRERGHGPDVPPASGEGSV